MSTNKIIITTDLSPESFSAFIIGKEYSKALNCEIELLTVLEDPVQAAMIYAMEYPVFPGVEIQKQLFERVQKELDGLAKEHFGGFKVATTGLQELPQMRLGFGRAFRHFKIGNPHRQHFLARVSGLPAGRRIDVLQPALRVDAPVPV